MEAQGRWLLAKDQKKYGYDPDPWNPSHVSELQELVVGREAWRVAIHGVEKSWT